MTEFRTRFFQAGALVFTVTSHSAEVRDTVEALFHDLDEADPAVDGEQIILREADRDGSPGLSIEASVWSSPAPVPPDIGLDLLVSLVNRLALAAEPQGLLHIHAAGVVSDQRGVVLCAPSGTGKSVVTAALLMLGWDYMTDEMLGWSPAMRTLSAFPKPVTIKRSGHHFFGSFAASRVAIEYSRGASYEIPVGRLGVPIVGQSTPALLVFLQRPDAADGAELELLEPADAAVLLFEAAVDAERFGSDAIEMVTALASAAPSYRVMVTDDPFDTARKIQSLIDSLEEQPHLDAPVRVPRPAQIDHRAEFCVPASVDAVILNDRVVIHDRNTRSVAALDTSGSALWLSVFGSGAGAPDPFDEPGPTVFLRSLVSQGFLAKVDP